MQSLTPKTLHSTLISIQKNLEGIRSVTSSTVIVQKKQIVVQKKQKEEDIRKKKEDKLEGFKSFLGKSKDQVTGVKKNLGILDYIKNFATFVFWGFILNKLLPHLPKLKQILPALSWLGSAFDWITDLIGNGVVNFIDTAYKAQDSLRGVAKSIGGVKYERAFDDFTKNFNTFLNLAVLGGLAAAGSGIIPKVLGKGLDKIAGKGAQKVITSTGRAIGQGSSRITTSGGRTVAEVGKKSAPKLLARGGKFLGKVAGNSAPIIGPLINFGIRVWSGDDPGKAAAGSVGMGIGQVIGGFLGGALGTALGTAVPILGNILVGGIGVLAGQIIGGLIGEWIGDSLYDFANSGNKKPRRKTEGRAGGGVITRNGVPVGGKIKRTVKPARKSFKKPDIRKSMPGKNVGGKKIEKIFPNPQDQKKVNPLKTLTYAAQKYNSVSLVGGILRAGVEGAMGQSMDPNVMKNFATNIGTLVQNIVDGNIKSTNTGLNTNILAMASGGLVPERTAGLNQLNIGEQVGTILAKSLNLMVNNRMNEIFQNIMKQYEKEDVYGETGPLDALDRDSSADPQGGGIGAGDSSGAGIVYNALIAEGFNHEQASGVIGNLMQESGGGTKNINPRATNGTHYGIAQWDKQHRWPRLERYIRSIGKDPNTVEGQVAGLTWEMKTHEKRAYRLLKKTTSAEGAAVIFLKEFERSGEVPGQHGYDNRIINANKIAKEFTATMDSPSNRGVGNPRGQNGRLPASELMDVGDGQKLWKPAAQAYLRMKEDAKKDKVYFRLSEGYRTLETQKQYWANPPSGPGTAAVPGTSKHGWGKAIDISSAGAQAWIRKNGRKYGWIWPDWAQKSPYEPWHFEYVGGGSIGIVNQDRINQRLKPGESKLSSDIKEFRQFRTQFGAPAQRFASANPQNYQIREMGVHGSGNYGINPMADDTNYEVHEHKGSGHWENRAFDIPVPRLSAEGDRVAQFWRDRGYTVLWRVSGHDNHVHVEVPKNRVSEFMKVYRQTPVITKPKAQSAKISAVPQSSRITPQSIAMYDSTTTRTQTVVAYQPVIQPQPTPVPVGSRGGLFPGESINVNTDKQLQAKALA
jgi:hypothetical protein